MAKEQVLWAEDEMHELVTRGVDEFIRCYPERSYHSARHKLARMRASGAGIANEPLIPEIQGRTAGREINIEAIRRESQEAFAQQFDTDTKRKHNEVRFDYGPVAIFFVGDQHIGNAGTDIERMFDEQETILSTPGAYVVLTGDTIDNFIVGKLLMENAKDSLAIQKQWDLAKHYIEAFGDRLIGVNSGNHNQWATKLMGVDYDRQITPNGVLYDADEINFTVAIGDGHSVRILVRHKWRGNSLYNPTHAIERAARFDSSRPDVFVGAHVHQGATAREFTLDCKRKLALMSSSYKVYDGYQRQEGFTNNDASTAVGLVIESDGSFWGTSNLSAIQRYLSAIYL